MNITIKGIDELKKNLETFKKEANDSISKAVFHGATIIANYAKLKENHPYQDRTGLNTESIQAGLPEVTGTKIRAEASANMEYSAKLEFGSSKTRPYPYMFPALEANSNIIKQGIVSALKAIKWIK